MHRFVSWLALAPLACTALNPAFSDGDALGEGSNGGDGSGSVTSTSTMGRGPDSNDGSAGGSTPESTSGMSSSGPASASGSAPHDFGSGPSLPSYRCNEPGFNIEILDSELSCADLPAGTAVNVDLECMAFSQEGGGLEATPATGCDGTCEVLAGATVSVFVPGIDLPEALDVAGSTCGYLWARGVAEPSGCQWDNLSLFHADGRLALMLGNGVLGEGSPVVLPLPSDIPVRVVELSAGFLEQTTCGERSDMVCANAGWRQLEFAATMMPALPDGSAASAELSGQALSVFNWGIQLDRQCETHGRWAVVEAGRESLFE